MRGVFESEGTCKYLNPVVSAYGSTVVFQLCGGGGVCLYDDAGGRWKGAGALSLSLSGDCLFDTPISSSRRRQLHERIGMNVGSRTVVRDVIPVSTTVL